MSLTQCGKWLSGYQMDSQVTLRWIICFFKNQTKLQILHNILSLQLEVCPTSEIKKLKAISGKWGGSRGLEREQWEGKGRVNERMKISKSRPFNNEKLELEKDNVFSSLNRPSHFSLQCTYGDG